MSKLLYEDITFDIRGVCFLVWKKFRGTFKGKIIDRALSIELRKRGRVVEDQERLGITYQGITVGTYVSDKIIDGKVAVELKCKEFITKQDVDQFWKYLKGSKHKAGLLINFGSKELEIKRVVYDSARETRKYPRLNLWVKSPLLSAEKGFTLMELVVASTIFMLVSVALMSLFNYTLKINRRGDALRQASQATRDMVETLVKEVRNGQIDYLVVNGTSPSPLSPIGPCVAPLFSPSGGGPYSSVSDTYDSVDNRLGIIDSKGNEECVYLAYGLGALGGNTEGAYVGGGVFSASADNPKPILMMQKSGLSPASLTPVNVYVNKLAFYVRPTCDAYSDLCNNGNGYEQVQPFVTIAAEFIARLPTGESVAIDYQTSVSTNKYDVPH